MPSIAAVQDEQDWDLQLPTIMFTYRTSIHVTTKATPFSLMFSREARLLVDVMYSSPPGDMFTSSSDYAYKLRERLTGAFHFVQKNAAKEAERLV